MIFASKGTKKSQKVETPVCNTTNVKNMHLHLVENMNLAMCHFLIMLINVISKCQLYPKSNQLVREI